MIYIHKVNVMKGACLQKCKRFIIPVWVSHRITPKPGKLNTHSMVYSPEEVPPGHMFSLLVDTPADLGPAVSGPPGEDKHPVGTNDKMFKRTK